MIELRGTNMKKILGMVALMAAPIAANAQAVTIDFKGTIADASGIFAGDTGTIAGSYVFNYSNADPTQSAGTVGSALGWQSSSAGAYMFSTAAVFNAGNNIYSDGPPGSLSNQSIVLATPGQSFLAANWQQTDPNDFTLSALGITSTGTPWSHEGLPVFGAGDQVPGEIEVEINGAPSLLDYNVTSLQVVRTRAPEISPASAASGLTLLLGGLAVLRGRRPKKLTSAVS
jgi:hypothetical protein